MASNPLNMKPTELIRLINRAGFGTVLNESRLKTHRLSDINTADGKGVDLLKYAAWLTLEYFTNEDDGADKYVQRRIRETQRNAEAVRTHFFRRRLRFSRVAGNVETLMMRVGVT